MRAPQIVVLGAGCVAMLLLTGCAEKRPRVYPWATAIVLHPRVPAPRGLGATPPDLNLSAPDLPWDFAPENKLFVARQPPRPRGLVQPAPEPAGASKTEAPSLEPELSPQEVAAAQLQVNENMGAAQRNLDAAKNHRLNTTQSDLVSKVNAFLDESKAAVKEGDWTRAKNLAKKAQLLSEELANSF